MATLSLSYQFGGLVFNVSSPRGMLVVSFIFAATTALLLVIVRLYAKHRVAVTTPPWCDPDSYQCRLTAAMIKADIQYTDIVSATLAEMDKMWKSEQALCERFRIQGLRDPEDRRLVYDIVIKFYNNGGIILQFPSEEICPKTKPGILISNATETEV